MRDAATRLGTGASGTADVMADGFFAPLDFALVMQRANPNPYPNPNPNPKPKPKPKPKPNPTARGTGLQPLAHRGAASPI